MPDQMRAFWRQARRRLRHAGRWVGRAVALTTTTFAALLVIGIIWLLADELLDKHRIEIGSIGVPKRLIEDGFSADVATRRLRDAVRFIEDRAQTTMRKADVQIGQSLPDFTIPEAGVSIAGVAASIRRLLPEGWRHEVSGEFTTSGTQLTLRLRMNEHVAFEEKDTDPVACRGLTDSNAIDSLIKRGALKLVETMQPAVAAIYYNFAKCDPDAEALANQIIVSRPREDENVARAYNLKGIIAWQRKDYREAEEFLRDAKGLSISFGNLGFFYLSQDRFSRALAEFRKAVRLDNRSASAHYGIGSVWLARPNDGATGAPSQEFLLDPQFGLPSIDIGEAWANYGTLDDSVAEYRRAIWLDPAAVMAHYGLGLIYQAKGDLDNAVSEYRKVIQIETEQRLEENRDIAPYVSLATILQTREQPAEAIDYFRGAIRIKRKQADLQYKLGMALGDLAPSTKDAELLHDLQDECAAFQEASSLARTDRAYRAWLPEFQLRLAETDAMLVSLSTGLN